MKTTDYTGTPSRCGSTGAEPRSVTSRLIRQGAGGEPPPPASCLLWETPP